LTRLSAAALLLFSTLALPGVAAAQASATATVTATASVNAAITVTNTKTLSFGAVTQNEVKTVAATDPSAGQLVFTGTPSSPASVTFMSIPTTLVGPGGAQLRIDTFSGYFNTVNTASGGTSFVPSPVAQAAGVSSATGQLYIFFGATVRPTSEQPTGAYSATIVMQVAY
jgi:hypothetical protein